MSTKMLLAILFFSFLVDFLALFSISTHRMGSDADGVLCRVDLLKFQPALPVWGVTVARRGDEQGDPISTRTPRVGSDTS